MKKYKGHALITGGDTGIGYAIAEELAMKGYNLVLVARNEAALEKAQNQLTSKYKIDVLTFSKDLTEENSSKEVFDFVQDKGIHVALLVTNAGFGAFGRFDKSNDEHVTKMINLMCRSLTELTYLFLPDMEKKKEGGIILISSILSRLLVQKYAVYCACKAYTSSFGTILNFELRSKKIDVLVVSPAVIKTRFDEGQESKIVNERMQSKWLGLKYHTPEEVAKVVVKSLGKKIEVVAGSLLDKFFFYSLPLAPLALQRLITQSYYKMIADYDLDK